MALALKRPGAALERQSGCVNAQLVLRAMPRRSLGTVALALVLGLACTGTAAAVAAAAVKTTDPPSDAGHTAPRLVSVEPACDGALLVCRVVTAGLPGEKLALSMQSGLVSSIELQLDVLDARQRIVAANRITFRLAFDLWEEIFAVEWNGEARRLADTAELQALLADLQRLPVAPLDKLAPEGRFLVRAGLSLQAVASSEKERVESAIGAAPPPPEDRAGGRQEATVGLGRLIKLFYHSAARRPDLVDEVESAWFVPRALAAAKELPRAPD